MKTSLHVLLKLLVQAERDMGLDVSSSKDVLAINNKSKGKFKRSTSKGKKPNKGKGKVIGNNSSKPKKGASSEYKCHYCCGMGHWKQNCPKYIRDVKAGRVTSVGHVSKDKGKDKQARG
ncbi:uncharacterized protein LOC141588306 [Silene latifolia]|uniref:uncharacterized protein LOC141588306 n=1 Tax=Silene latifolia TaxID=37657 RepID=UPI003D77650E